MSTKNKIIALAIAILISTGFAAAEAEIMIINTAVIPGSSLSLPGILPMAAPAAPSTPKINFDPRKSSAVSSGAISSKAPSSHPPW